MGSGIFAAWYCTFIFLNLLTCLVRCYIEGLFLCWSLLFLSLSHWECSQKFSQSYNIWHKHAKKTFKEKQGSLHFSSFQFGPYPSHPCRCPCHVFISFLISIFVSKWIIWSERSLIFWLGNMLCNEPAQQSSAVSAFYVSASVYSSYISSHIPSTQVELSGSTQSSSHNETHSAILL